MSATIDIRELNEKIERQSAFVTNLQTGMSQVIVGQKHLVESLLIGLLSDGHILLEGLPGLAKTLAIKTLSELIDADFCITDIYEAYQTNITKLTWHKQTTHKQFYSLFLVIEGSAEYIVNKKIHRVDKGTIIFQKKGETWDGRGINNGTDEHWRFIEISFYAAKDNILKLMPNIFSNINLKHYIPKFKEMINLSYLNPPLCHLKKKVLLYNIISNLISECSDETKKENKRTLIVNSLEYMKANIYECSLNISDIAEKSRISEDYFRKIFNP